MRVFRTFFAPLALLLLSTGGALAAQDEAAAVPAEKLALARQIIDVMYPAETREQMLLDISGNFARQAMAGSLSGPLYAEPGIRAIADRFIADMPEAMRPVVSRHLPKIFEATAIAYTRQFTLEELRDILAFGRTPAGQRYFTSLPAILSDPAIAAANQAYMAEIMPVSREAGLRARGELEAYLRAHPEVVARLQRAAEGHAD